MFESAIAAARRVRSRTAIGRGTASVPSASVEFARRRLGTLSQSTVLLIGTGNIGELGAKQLVTRRPKPLLVLVRPPSPARPLAYAPCVSALTPDKRGGGLVGSDVVISATCAPQPVVDGDQLLRARAHCNSASAPLLLIDLSVPRAIDPAATELPGIELHA